MLFAVNVCSWQINSLNRRGFVQTFSGGCQISISDLEYQTVVSFPPE